MITLSKGERPQTDEHGKRPHLAHWIRWLSVPIIMPPIMRLLTSAKERAITMPYTSREISQRTRILFPIVVTVVVGTLVPFATPLIGMLMLGNLMRESKVVERLTGAASNELANIVTLFLGFDKHDEYKVMGLAPYGEPKFLHTVRGAGYGRWEFAVLGEFGA